MTTTTGITIRQVIITGDISLGQTFRSINPQFGDGEEYAVTGFTRDKGYAILSREKDGRSFSVCISYENLRKDVNAWYVDDFVML